MSANPVQPASPEARYGEVFDLGYQHYDGPRRGRRGAIMSLISYSMKRAMGVRKSWTAKVMPFLLYLSASIPLIVIVGIQAVMGSMGDDMPFGYTSFFTFIFMLVGMFVAIAAPEMICVDRHERTLPLYFSRAIERSDYVLAKVVAMTLLTMTMTAVPGVILWLGTQLVHKDSIRKAMVDHADDLWKVIIYGAIMALTLGSLGLMVSSFTNRKGVAITLIILGFIVLTAIAQSVFETLKDHDWAKYILLLDFGTMFQKLGHLLFHDAKLPSDQERALDFSQWQVIGYMLLVSLVALLITRWRYAQRDDM